MAFFKCAFLISFSATDQKGCLHLVGQSLLCLLPPRRKGRVDISYPWGRGDGLFPPCPCLSLLCGAVGVLFGEHPGCPAMFWQGGGEMRKAESYSCRELRGALGWAPPAQCSCCFAVTAARQSRRKNTARERSLCSSPEVRNIPQIKPRMSLTGSSAVP